jgi:glycosyltransferase involved in cell wall biosynthesis
MIINRATSSSEHRVVSVVIPARNEGGSIAGIIRAVQGQATPELEIEVIVVDDSSTDATRDEASEAGARVLRLVTASGQGNPAAARNLGASESRGDPIVFLDADCTVLPGWLPAILRAHDRGATVVGGALDMPPGLSPSARCDYYCGWYLIHSRRPAGIVPHHPPPNLSVRREPFLSSSRFTEEQPYSYTNEERHWEAELQSGGHMIWFEPAAVVYHHNRPGFGNLLRRNYRWAYTAIGSKHETRAARMAWLYRYPLLAIVASVPLAFAHTAFIIWCWVRAGRFEPVVMLPAILLSRLAYAAGISVGGVRWMRSRNRRELQAAPRWK